MSYSDCDVWPEIHAARAEEADRAAAREAAAAQTARDESLALVTRRDLQGSWGPEREDGTSDYIPPEKRTEPVQLELVLGEFAAGELLRVTAKYAKIAERHGQTLTAVKTGEVRVPHKTFKDRTVLKHVYLVTIPPIVGVKGEVVAHFEKAEDNTSQYVHVFKEAFRTEAEARLPRAGECDHCGTRRDRTHSYVCNTPDGIKIVGRSCLIDFLGVDPALALACCEFAKAASPGDADPDDFFGGSWRANYENTDHVVREAYRVGRKNGGYSKDTSDLLYREFAVLLWGRRAAGNDEEYARIKEAYKGFDPEFDVQALADYVEHANGDFGSNLRVALSQDIVLTKRLRLVLAGVCLFVGRAIKRDVDTVKDAARPAAKQLEGAVGARVEIVGEVVRTFLREGEFGITCIVAIRTADGGAAVNFHTGKDRPEAGKFYAIRGTIKRQGENKRTGEPETTLGRCIYKDAPAQGSLI